MHEITDALEATTGVAVGASSSAKQTVANRHEFAATRTSISLDSELATRLIHNPEILADAEAILEHYLSDSRDFEPAIGDPASFGWESPMMLPSKKKAAAAIAVAIAVAPAVPRRPR